MTNSFEKKALDTIAENKILLAENKALTNEVNGYRKRVCQMCDGHGMVGNILDSMDCPDCTKVMNSVKVDAIEVFARDCSESSLKLNMAAMEYCDNLLRANNG